MERKKRVVIGLSGGIDSAISCYLLKNQGYEVIGLFMRNWDSFLNNDFLGNKTSFDDQCPQEKDYEDAKDVAKFFNIELHRVDFVKEYWDDVFSYLIEEYKKGRTPNPDIFCNKYIKFAKFADFAFNKLNADYIATGHYAKTKNGKLYKAFDDTKDQSYFLAQLSNKQLEKVIFPLDSITKKEVRLIANKLGLSIANKKDSTGICFIGERKFTEFLENYIPSKPGNIIDIATNKVVGKHIGAMYYTIGQRKGLNLGGYALPYFVVGHNLKDRILYVANERHKEYLLSNSLVAINTNFLETNFDKNNLTAKFRYRQKDIKINLEILDNNKVLIKYDYLEAITPGQQVVVYEKDKVILGAIIDKVFYDGKEKTYI